MLCLDPPSGSDVPCAQVVPAPTVEDGLKTASFAAKVAQSVGGDAQVPPSAGLPPGSVVALSLRSKQHSRS